VESFGNTGLEMLDGDTGFSGLCKHAKQKVMKIPPFDPLRDVIDAT
jgi:hypothetical protein